MKSVATLILSFVLLSCAPIESDKTDDQDIRFAACQAQAYLARNGYLEHLIDPDFSEIDLGLWDKMNYEVDGSIDWKQLLADREGTFTGRLFGVGRRDYGYLVYYKFEGSYSCVKVGDEPAMPHLTEANCLRNPPLSKLHSGDLLC